MEGSGGHQGQHNGVESNLLTARPERAGLLLSLAQAAATDPGWKSRAVIRGRGNTN